MNLDNDCGRHAVVDHSPVGPAPVRIRVKVAEPAVEGFPEVSCYRDSEELAVETGSDPIEVRHEIIFRRKADQPDAGTLVAALSEVAVAPSRRTSISCAHAAVRSPNPDVDRSLVNIRCETPDTGEMAVLWNGGALAVKRVGVVPCTDPVAAGPRTSPTSPTPASLARPTS